MRFHLLLIFAIAKSCISLHLSTPDLRGQYLIGDFSRVKTLNNINKAISDVSYFSHQLIAEDSPIPSIHTIEDFLRILIQIKEIIERSQIKVCEYKTADIAIITNHANQLKKIEQSSEALFHLDVANLQKYPKRENEIKLQENFANLDADFLSIWKKYKTHYRRMSNRWQKILVHFTEITEIVNEINSNITKELKEFKTFVLQPKNITDRIADDIDAIQRSLVRKKFPPNKFEVMMEKVTNINSNVKQFENLDQIGPQTRKIENSLKKLHAAIKCLPAILENVLSATPTMIYDRETVEQMITTNHEESISIEARYITTNLQWQGEMVQFLEDNKKLLRLNVVIGALNGQDIDAFNSNPEFNTKQMKQIGSKLSLLKGHLDVGIRYPHDLLLNIEYSYKELFTSHWLKISNLKFDKGNQTELEQIVKSKREKVANLVEPIRMATEQLAQHYANVRKTIKNCRVKMIYMKYLKEFYQDDELKNQIKSHGNELEILASAALTLLSDIFNAEAEKIRKNIDDEFMKLNTYNLELQTELETWFSKK